MGYSITRAVIIGAGVMGAGIAAHLANCGLKVLLLDRVPAGLSRADMERGWREDIPEWRNSIASSNFAHMASISGPAFISPASRDNIKFGNMEDNIHEIGAYDWIIETIMEDLEVKACLYATIELHRRPETIVTTNTSGIPIRQISREFSDEMAQHFLGTHFFNPTTYIPLVEVIPGPETPAALTDFMVRFLRERLGKRPLVVRDSPNFICNRLAVAFFLNVLYWGRERGFTVEEIDALCGRALGRSRGAAFQTADTIGLDTAALVIRNIWENAPHDERRAIFVVPDYVQRMIDKNLLGAKTGQGFYRNTGQENGRQAIDLDALEYRPLVKPDFPCLQAAEQAGNLAGQLQAMVWGDDPGSQFAWEILASDLNYAANRLGEIADSVEVIDKAMQWGYAWQLGPFECWDAIGVERSVERMKKEGLPVARYVEEMLLFGCPSFYIRKLDGARYYYDFRTYSYRPCQLN
ncbi:MAG: 3-hydroxyacyl-CoA dehydrogenase family protein [Syntrophomonadaceae bacterium]